MGTLLSIVGFVGFILYGILGIVSIFKKNGLFKKRLIISGVSFIVMIAGSSMLEPSDIEPAVTEAESSSDAADLDSSDAADDQTSAESTEKEVDTKTNESSEDIAAEKELSQEELDKKEIKEKVKSISKDYQTTTIQDIRVNEDLGKGEGYIVLIDLSFDIKNKPDTAKEMIDMYSNDLGANLADLETVNEVTTFWVVPYLQEDGNIVKYNMERVEGGMAINEEYYDPNIFEQ
ncbi:hypothetical protein [Halobacillus sp. Marseille-Q1614]|uniref:hypothetical protein n=1 Tax=Halobacillus sp. Marseille-Q1614 TaxID=2709134 RepID=UPI00156F57B6|nr:hypothetical protein [Halobacillus sp. Marseille-Q1614]